MKRGDFLKLAAAAVLAPYVGRLPSPPLAAETSVLSVSGAPLFAVGDVLRCLSAGEAMLVTAVAPGRLTVTRGIGALAPRPLEGHLLRVGDVDLARAV